MIKLLLALLIGTAHAASITDHSGTILIGGTAQTLMPANAARHGCSIQNVSQFDMWFFELGTAAAAEPAFLLPAGSQWTCPGNGVPTGAISIFGILTGQEYTARDW